MRYDLHCHSTASDGLLSPSEIIQRALEQNIDVLALTDHDTLDGLKEARIASQNQNIVLIPGVEISADFYGRVLHIVALDFIPNDSALYHGLKESDAIRRHRGERILEKFRKKNMLDVADTAKELAGTQALTRTHFARALVQLKYSDTLQGTFDKWLGQGKSCYVKTQWPSLSTVLDWIIQSEGRAVLAHPLRYNLSAAWLRRVIAHFKEHGGQGFEVCCGANTPEMNRRSAEWAKRYDLLASCGSDFHSPENPWVELGRIAPIPKDLIPIWNTPFVNAF